MDDILEVELTKDYKSLNLNNKTKLCLSSYNLESNLKFDFSKYDELTWFSCLHPNIEFPKNLKFLRCNFASLKNLTKENYENLETLEIYFLKSLSNFVLARTEFQQDCKFESQELFKSLKNISIVNQEDSLLENYVDLHLSLNLQTLHLDNVKIYGLFFDLDSINFGNSVIIKNLFIEVDSIMHKGVPPYLNCLYVDYLIIDIAKPESLFKSLCNRPLTRVFDPKEHYMYYFKTIYIKLSSPKVTNVVEFYYHLADQIAMYTKGTKHIVFEIRSELESDPDKKINVETFLENIIKILQHKTKKITFSSRQYFFKNVKNFAKQVYGFEKQELIEKTTFKKYWSQDNYHLSYQKLLSQ